jgi:hypothetical protein
LPELDLPTTLVISRTELGLPSLNLNDTDNGYAIVRGGFGWGGRTWRRQVVQSPFTDGRTVVGRVMDIVTREFTFRLRAATASALDQKVGYVIDAFSQFAYTLTPTVNGVTYAWRCETADLAVGSQGKLDEFQEMALMREITATVPCNPRPLSGHI